MAVSILCPLLGQAAHLLDDRRVARSGALVLAIDGHGDRFRWRHLSHRRYGSAQRVGSAPCHAAEPRTRRARFAWCRTYRPDTYRLSAFSTARGGMAKLLAATLCQGRYWQHPPPPSST